MFVGWYWLFAGFAWDTRRTKSSLIVTETALNGGGNGDLSWFGGGCNCENLLPDAGKLPGWKMMVFVAPGCHAEQSGSDLSRESRRAQRLGRQATCCHEAKCRQIYNSHVEYPPAYGRSTLAIHVQSSLGTQCRHAKMVTTMATLIDDTSKVENDLGAH